MDEFCEVKYLYRTTFLVKKGKLKKCVFSEPRQRSESRQRYLDYICDDPLYITGVCCFSFYIFIRDICPS